MSSSITGTPLAGSPVSTSSPQTWDSEPPLPTGSSEKGAPSSVTYRNSGDLFPLEADRASFNHLSGQQNEGKRIEGWPLLAELMAVTPSFEAFSRFQRLNVKNLLYYQAELKELELSLEEREWGDMRNPLPDDSEKGYMAEIHESPEVMINMTKCPQWNRVKKLRVCLREYNEALLQYAQVSALAEPTTHNMKELVRWMYDEKYGKGRIGGVAGGEWGPYERKEFMSIPSRLLHLLKSVFKPSPKSPYVSNLVAPRGRGSTDGLSRWIAEELIPCSHDVKDLWAKTKDKRDVEHRGEDGSSQQQQGKDQVEQQGRALDDRVGKVHEQTIHARTILGITAKISTLFACMTPIIAIFLLVSVQNLYHKLAMISFFAFLFGSSLMILADATRVQIFTATSAFLAVLVVFIPVGGG